MDADIKIIVLNGVSSVGKSSAARALQRLARRPFLHVSMDAFLEMLPPRTLDHPDGITFRRLEDEGGPSVEVTTGFIVDRALRGMRRAVAAMAAQGNHLIVDDVMFGEDEEREYRELLSVFDLRLVGLFAPLDVIEARELARGDRDIGLARWQFDRVHRGRAYDLEIDVSRMAPEAVAERLREAFDL